MHSNARGKKVHLLPLSDCFPPFSDSATISLLKILTRIAASFFFFFSCRAAAPATSERLAGRYRDRKTHIDLSVMFHNSHLQTLNADLIVCLIADDLSLRGGLRWMEDGGWREGGRFCTITAHRLLRPAGDPFLFFFSGIINVYAAVNYFFMMSYSYYRQFCF